MTNAATRLAALLPGSPLQVGTVAESSGGQTTVSLPGGATIRVRGAATPGELAWFRSGVIESTGAAMPIDTIEV